uniref:Basigin (Ok blood group) n=1 Tax=Pipistrellus kuhlii TaxID=59472 RepID=A0A7J7X982_PIPKU|nr:basigin (Ok blood group) [Pipistrellus kuhlii]
MAAAQLVVLGLVLLGVERGFGAGNISTSMLDVGSKTRLTCTLDSSDTAILGHRWMKGDKVLQEDSEADLTTQFEALTRPSSLCVYATASLPSGPSWVSWLRCSCLSPSSSSMRSGGSQTRSWMMKTWALLH